MIQKEKSINDNENETSSNKIPTFQYSSQSMIVREDWCWDENNKSEKIVINNKIATFFPKTISEGTAGVRGTKGFTNGVHYFEVKLNKPLKGTSIMFGYSTKDTNLNFENYEYVNLIGYDNHSWGLSHNGDICSNLKTEIYCQKFTEAETRIGVLLDFNDNSLLFYKNGVELGVAFKNFIKRGQMLFPTISSTATDVEIEIVRQFRIYLNLKEFCSEVIKNFVKTEDYKYLMLPHSIVKDWF